MCGILVVYFKDGAVDGAACERALDRLRKRGPDFSSAEWLHDRRLFIGRTVLSIVGDPAPVIREYDTSRSGRFDLAYNGEIYNHEQLFARRLRDKGYERPSGTDTETLVNLHEVQSPEEVYRQLRGMFAYVVYDRERRRLLIGRDLLGEKILYAYEDSRTLVIASEIGPILEIAPSLSIDRDVLREYFFTRHLLMPSQTAFQGVRLIPPGHLLEYDLDRCALRTLASRQLADLIDPAEIERRKRGTLADAADEFEARLHAIAQTIAPVSARYSAVLSGGVDTSLSSLALAENGCAPASVISLQFPGKDKPSEDLSGFERRLQRPVNSVRVDAGLFGSVFASCYQAAGGPLGTHSFVSQAILSRHARALGSKVLIGGDGGDELFGGYDFYRTLTAGADFPDSNPSIYSGFVPLGFEFAGWTPDALRQRIRDRWQAFAGYYQFESDPRQRMVQTVLYSDTVIQLESVGIRSADTMSMLNSVESRGFYLTEECLEFALNLPAAFKINLEAADESMITRPLLKTVFVRRFGRELLFPKQGFSGYPNEAGRALVDSQYPLVREVLGLTRLPSANGLQQQAAEWKLINVELFLQHFRKHI